MTHKIFNDEFMKTIEFVLSHKFTAQDVAQHLIEQHGKESSAEIAMYCIQVFKDEKDTDKIQYWRGVLDYLKTNS